jgi:hypothetical protein
MLVHLATAHRAEVAVAAVAHQAHAAGHGAGLTFQADAGMSSLPPSDSVIVLPTPAADHLLHRLPGQRWRRRRRRSVRRRASHPAPSSCPWCRRRRSCHCGPAAPPGRCPPAWPSASAWARAIDMASVFDAGRRTRRARLQAISSSSSHQRCAWAASPSVTTTADRPAFDVGIGKADEHAWRTARPAPPSRGSGPAALVGAVVAALAHHVRQHRPGGRRPWPGFAWPASIARMALPARRPVS